MKHLLIVILLFISLFSFGQSSKVLKKDDSQIQKREFQDETIEDYQSNRDFQYGVEAKPVSGFWDILLYQFLKGLLKVLSNRTILTILTALIIIFALYRILKGQHVGLFAFGKKSSKIKFSEVSDDIYANDLDELLQKAIEEHAYRHAVRILYLKLLRQLSDKGIIEWELEKTNHQYWYEIKTPNLLDKFKQLTHSYEYVWYGDFSIDRVSFEDIHTQFKNTYQEI